MTYGFADFYVSIGGTQRGPTTQYQAMYCFLVVLSLVLLLKVFVDKRESLSIVSAFALKQNEV